jgi:hypothetical protein
MVATMGGGEPITCACGAEGVVVDRSAPLDMNDLWFEVLHEGGTVHVIERMWDGDSFGFVFAGSEAT